MTIVTLQATQAVHDALNVGLIDSATPDIAARSIAAYASPESIVLALARVRRALADRRGAIGTQAEQILLAAASLVASDSVGELRAAGLSGWCPTPDDPCRLLGPLQAESSVPLRAPYWSDRKLATTTNPQRKV